MRKNPTYSQAKFMVRMWNSRKRLKKQSAARKPVNGPLGMGQIGVLALLFWIMLFLGKVRWSQLHVRDRFGIVLFSLIYIGFFVLVVLFILHLEHIGEQLNQETFNHAIP